MKNFYKDLTLADIKFLKLVLETCTNPTEIRWLRKQIKLIEDYRLIDKKIQHLNRNKNTR